MGWTQNPNHLTKYPRYFDLGLQKTINLSRTGTVDALDGHRDQVLPIEMTFVDRNANMTGDLLFHDEDSHSTRPQCGDWHDNGPGTFLRRKQLEKKYLVLEEDRIFHTCHLLPVEHYLYVILCLGL